MQEPPRTKSLIRAMDVLRAIVDAPDDASPARIAERTGLPRPTVYRLLGTLESIGLVEKTTDGDWAIGYELVRLGRAADHSRALASRAQPTLEELVAATGETAMLAIGHDPFNVDVISQVDAPNLLGMTQWVGRPVAPHASAAGKLVLAGLAPEERRRHVATIELSRFTDNTIVDPAAFARELEAVQQRGYATTIDELEEGLSGIAAPVLRPGGAMAAIIGVYGPTARVIGRTSDRCTEAVLVAARRLGDTL